MPEIPVVFWVRHGETTLNAQNCFRGTANPDLNANGLADAEELANFFAPKELSAIFYSDKKRSTKTAEIIGQKHPDVECFGTPNLWAWDVGKFSGKPKSPENVAALEEYIDNPDLRVPQGESLNEFKARIRPCIDEAIEIADQMGAPTMCVVHSSVIHEVGAYVSGDHAATLVEPGGVALIYYDGAKLQTKPLLKPLPPEAEPSHADTVT